MQDTGGIKLMKQRRNKILRLLRLCKPLDSKVKYLQIEDNKSSVALSKKIIRNIKLQGKETAQLIFVGKKNKLSRSNNEYQTIVKNRLIFNKLIFLLHKYNSCLRGGNR